MSVFYNLADLGAGLKDLLRRVDIIETNDGAGYTSVDEGSFRVRSNEGLLVEGSQKVSGWLIVTGTLKVVGTFLLDGITTITGALTAKGTTRFEGDTSQVGPFHVTGATDFKGNVLIDGLSTLTKRLTVTSPGDIRVGGTIPMTIGNAIIGFDSGGSVVGYSGGMRVASGGAPDIVVSTGGVSITGGSGPYLTVSAGGHLLGGHKTTTMATNVYLDTATGLLSRTTSAARFKIDPQPMNLPDALLEVPVKEWIDLGNAERFAAVFDKPRPLTESQQLDFDSVTLARVPGAIAEEVEVAGGSAFVTYDEDNNVTGVAYDRYALARTEILRRRLATSDRRIDDLESKFDTAMELISDLQQRLREIETGEPTDT